jgi:WD40 repeat protein
MIQRQVLATCVIVVFAIGCSRRAPAPEDPVSSNLHKFRLDGGFFSNDGKRVLFTDALGEVPNVFVWDVETGNVSPVTTSKRAAYPISFLPDDGRILYRMQPEGQSVEHLFLHGSAGTDTDLTPWAGVQAVFYGWSQQKGSFYLGSNKDDRRFLYLYSMNVADKTPVLVLETQDMQFTASSRTGRYLALWRRFSVSKSAVWVYDFGSKALDKIAPVKDDGVAVPQFFDADDLLYYLTNEDMPVLALAKYDFAKKERSRVHIAGQSIIFARRSVNQRYFVIGLQQGDHVVSHLFDTSNQDWSEIPLSEPGLILDISPDGRSLLYNTAGEGESKGLQLYNIETKEVRKIRPH